MNELEVAEIQQIEVEINFYKGQAVQSIFEIGERLIKAKELVEHGEWENWLENKVDFSNQQARRLMQVSREFPNRSVASGLSQTKVFELLAVPKEERETFIEETPVEDMTTRELRQAIKEKKNLEKQLEETQHKHNDLLAKNLILEHQKPKIIEKEVIKEVIPEDVKKELAKLEEMQNRLNELNKESSQLRDYGKSKQQIEFEIKELSEQKNKQENLYNEMTILARKARQVEGIETTRRRLIRNVSASTDELKRNRYKIEEVYKELTDVGEVAKQRLIKEADFLEDMARLFKDMANEKNTIDIKYEILEGEIING